MDRIFFKEKDYKITKMDAFFIGIFEQDGLLHKTPTIHPSIVFSDRPFINDSCLSFCRAILNLDKKLITFKGKHLINPQLWQRINHEMKKVIKTKRIYSSERSEVRSYNDHFSGKPVKEKILTHEYENDLFSGCAKNRQTLENDIENLCENNDCAKISQKKGRPKIEASEDDYLIAEKWKQFANSIFPYFEYNLEEQAHAIRKLRQKFKIKDNQYFLDVLTFIENDHFWFDKACSPANLYLKSNNGLTKWENLIRSMNQRGNKKLMKFKKMAEAAIAIEQESGNDPFPW